MSKESLEKLAEQCLSVIASKQAEIDQTRWRLEGAAEGVKFLLDSLVGSLEAANGQGDKPVSSIAKG